MSLKEKIFGKKEEVQIIGINPAVLKRLPKQIIPEEDLPNIEENNLFEKTNGAKFESVKKVKEVWKKFIDVIENNPPKMEYPGELKEPRPVEIITEQPELEKKEKPIYKELKTQKLDPIPAKKLSIAERLSGVVSKSEVSKSEVSKSEVSKSEVSKSEVSKSEVPKSEVPKPVEAIKREIKAEIEIKKEPITVLDKIQEKKRKKAATQRAVEFKKEPKVFSYEDAVERYELEQIRGPVASKAGVPKAVGPPARFSRSEINKLFIIHVMPSFVRSILAKRSNVKFMVYCGIFQLEFIKIVKTKEEGHKLMSDLKEALDYEAVLEIFPRRFGGEVMAVYARQATDLRGKYGGTPLKPRLMER